MVIRTTEAPWDARRSNVVARAADESEGGREVVMPHSHMQHLATMHVPRLRQKADGLPPMVPLWPVTGLAALAADLALAPAPDEARRRDQSDASSGIQLQLKPYAHRMHAPIGKRRDSDGGCALELGRAVGKRKGQRDERGREGAGAVLVEERVEVAVDWLW